MGFAALGLYGLGSRALGLDGLGLRALPCRVLGLRAYKRFWIWDLWFRSLPRAWIGLSWIQCVLPTLPLQTQAEVVRLPKP